MTMTMTMTPSNPSCRTNRAAAILSTLLQLLVTALPLSNAAPISVYAVTGHHDESDPDEPGLWAYLGTAALLVLLGGVFAGLTIALMGQDEIYLQVMATSGEAHERKNAKKVLGLLQKGKHWVLVTLLLGNVITNETLPIVLDHSLGGGWPAIMGSTILIVIFGEIAPQSICVRYGLPIGAWMSPFVLFLMWVLAPIAWPTAKLLDYLLGEDHGTTYKKAGLKTLVTLHRTLGESDARLNQDEVTIISAVLDLKEKPVGSIMTPMSDVFTLSADTVLDETMMDGILSEGYSRIPIYAVDKPRDFVGMLLVKMLITYDPEDCLRVRDFQLATLPETRPETSCLDIVNFFQEGKSHMVLVSDSPGEDQGALGVVTLEDVIEELIGEEIVDESDVFIDVHRAIRRLHPAPRYRYGKSDIVMREDSVKADALTLEGRQSRSASMDAKSGASERKAPLSEVAKTPPAAQYLARRRSSGADPLPGRSIHKPEVRQHLKHLGPSNIASRPKSTRINTVKIKPGTAGFVETLSMLPETRQLPADGTKSHSRAPSVIVPGEAQVNEGTSLLSAGRHAKDGTYAVGYGALVSSPTAKTQEIQRAITGDTSRAEMEQVVGASHSSRAAEPPKQRPSSSVSTRSPPSTPAKLVVDLSPSKNDNIEIHIQNRSSSAPLSHQPRTASQRSTSTLGSLHLMDSSEAKTKVVGVTRSGSITEHTVESGGVTKVVLETTSSSEDGERGHNNKGESEDKQTGAPASNGAHEDGDGLKHKEKDKKRKKKRSGKKKGKHPDSVPA